MPRILYSGNLDYTMVMNRFGSCLLAVLVMVAYACTATVLPARDWVDRPWMKTPKPVPGNGRTISLRSPYVTPFNAYLVGPEDADEAILLIHDRFGLNAFVASWADRLSEQGYRVLAVDLYDGRTVLRKGMGKFIWSQIDPVWIDADIDRGLSFLADGRTRVSVVAWGSSVGYALDLAARRPDDVAALLVFPGPATIDLTAGLPWMPMPVFRYEVAHSPFDLYLEEGREEIADATLEAATEFLTERDSALAP